MVTDEHLFADRPLKAPPLGLDERSQQVSFLHSKLPTAYLGTVYSPCIDVEACSQSRVTRLSNLDLQGLLLRVFFGLRH